MLRLDVAKRCGAQCGVSRLADITGLDVLGLPVFQAVRPWSRALSVHQGKGLTADAARMSALMEAVECSSAEGFAGERRLAKHAALAPHERSARADDFAAARGRLEDGRAIAWTPARRIGAGKLLWVPWSGVSLDFTLRPPDGVDRSSNGLAADFDRDWAIATALRELIERDAVAEWRAQPAARRALRAVDMSTIDDPWFAEFRAVALDAGIEVTVFLLESVGAWPVVACLMIERRADHLARGAVYGSACRPTAAEALVAATAEAAQSRATAISAVRDDILTCHRRGGPGFALAPPLPSGIAALDWRRICDHRSPRAATPSAMAEQLARAGYPDAAAVDLPCPADEAVAVKVFAPGLGAYGRRRRPVSEDR